MTTMLMRTDPFRELDRFAQQALGTAARPAVMPMDAWREGDAILRGVRPAGIDQESLDLDIERNVVTVRAERPAFDPTATCWPPSDRGRIQPPACSSATISTPTGSTPPMRTACCGWRIPVSERAKPRTIDRSGGGRQNPSGGADRREAINV